MCWTGSFMTKWLCNFLDRSIYDTYFQVPPLLPAEELFVAKPLTAEHSFTGGIEGPACDRDGNIYAVSFARTPTIGKITPQGHGEIFVEFTNGSLAQRDSL